MPDGTAVSPATAPIPGGAVPWGLYKKRLFPPSSQDAAAPGPPSARAPPTSSGGKGVPAWQHLPEGRPEVPGATGARGWLPHGAQSRRPRRWAPCGPRGPGLARGPALGGSRRAHTATATATLGAGSGAGARGARGPPAGTGDGEGATFGGDCGPEGGVRGDTGTPGCWHPVCPGRLAPPPVGATAPVGSPLPPTPPDTSVQRQPHVCTRTAHTQGLAGSHPHKHVCKYPGTHTHTCMHTPASTQVRSQRRAHTCKHTHTCKHMHTCKHTCKHTHVQTHMHMQTRTPMHVHGCTPMHVHTRTRRPWTQACSNARARTDNPTHARAAMRWHGRAQAGACAHPRALPCAYGLVHACGEAHARAQPCTHTRAGTCTHTHGHFQGCLLKSTRVGK